MIKDVKHIIFDLGGVLLNVDYDRTARAFIEGGITNFNDIYSQRGQNDFFDAWETGRINTEEFIKGLQKYAPMTDEQVVNAWNAMLGDFPLRRLQILQQLRLHYDVLLLSNTNEIHEGTFNKILMDTHGIPNIGVFFDKVYLSHRVGMRKPNKEIFERVLDEGGFKPEQTLFIDDSIQHIEGAQKLGIQTIFLDKGMTIEDNIFLPKQ